MNYILMNICAHDARLILEGQKTLEIRSTRPNKSQRGHDLQVLLYETMRDGGRGEIVGTFRCCDIQQLKKLDPQEVLEKSCMTQEQLNQYATATGKDPGDLWAWVVEEPLTFREPKPLRRIHVRNPPHSWQRISAEAALDALAEK